MENDKSVLVVIPTIYPSQGLVELCDYLSADKASNKILVIRNIPDNEGKLAEPLTLAADVFSTGCNLNWLHSCNLGLFEAASKSFQYVCVLNDDVSLKSFQPDSFLLHLVETMERHPDTGIAAPQYNGFWGENQRSVPWEIGPEDTKSNYADGTCMLIRTDLIETVGVLDAEFRAPGWGADVDYCHRAREAGYTIRVCQQAYLEHSKQIGGDSAEKFYGSAKAWQLKGLRQAHEDLQLKYGPEFRSLLKLPSGAYMPTTTGLQDVELLRQS